MRKVLLTAVLTLTGAAHAECICSCVNGSVQPICRSSLDLPPLCAPQLCPLVPPSIAPLQMPGIPPIGTTQCRQVQVWDPASGQYRWKTICQ